MCVQKFAPAFCYLYSNQVAGFYHMINYLLAIERCYELAVACCQCNELLLIIGTL